jgi:outer membrane protein OmpA-like peptidoglycan-associated protein
MLTVRGHWQHKEHTMTKQLLILMVAAGLASPAWTAETDKAPKEEKIGVGGGMALGAAAGGPVGAILGAAFGGWIGDKFHRERRDKLAMTERYEEANAEAESFEALFYGREQELAALRAEWNTEQRSYRDALEAALEVQVYFRTDETEPDEAARERLARLADLVASMDELAVIVAGHADARGDEEYNEQLSARRAAAVRDVLIQSGLPADRITANAEGERQSTAAEGDLDALAMERRVNLSIVDTRFGNRVAQQ